MSASPPRAYTPYPDGGGFGLVYRRELRAQVQGMRRWQGMLLVAGAPVAFVLLFILLLLTEASQSSELSWGYIAIPLLWFLTFAQAAMQTATVIARERELGTLDLLLVTPIRAADIVYGKLWAVLTPMLMAFGLAFVCIIITGVAAALDNDPMTFNLSYFAFLIAEFLCAACIGVRCSAYHKVVGRAIGLTMLFGILMQFVLLLLGILIISFGTYNFINVIMFFLWVLLILPSPFIAAGAVSKLEGRNQPRYPESRFR